MLWRGKNKFNHLEMVGKKKLIGFGALGLGSPMGNTYYVDNGATNTGDDNEGTDASYPLETIDGALAKCTDDNDDYIIVLDCWDADTYPISLDVSLCHVIGLSMPNPWGWATLSGGGTDVFRFAENYIELAGFNLVSVGADGIHMYANKGYYWLHNLNFAVAAASIENAIEFDSTYGTNSLIEECTFGATASHVTGYGITGGAHQVVIRNNVFMQCDTIAINITSSPNTGKIYGNLIATIDDVNGEAISLAAGVSGFMVCENRAMNGMLSAGYTYNPYRDLAANTANHWGMNYRGNTVVEPTGV